MEEKDDQEERGLWSQIFVMIAAGLVILGAILWIATEAGQTLSYRGNDMSAVDFPMFLILSAMALFFYGIAWLADTKRRRRMKKK